MTPPKRTQEDRPIAALLAPDLLVLLESSPASVAVETEEMHPRDLAMVVEAIPEERVATLLAALPAERAAQVLEYLDEELRTEVLEAMSVPTAALLLVEMNPDDRADVLDDLTEEAAEGILQAIPPEERLITERLLSYDPDSAGGLMTTDFVSVAHTVTVDEALTHVRLLAREGRQESMYVIYVTDADGRLSGVMSLRELLAAPEGANMADMAWEDVVSVPATADRSEVAQITSEYDLIAVPVVDEDRRLLGVVTVDDVIDAIEEEQTEDVQKMGGMEALDEPYTTIGFWQMIRKRAGWLAALFIGEMFTATAMGRFAGEIEQAVVLALFVPLIISSGGNSGSQATSLIIRAMAVREVTLADWWRVAMRELPAGFTLGVILGLIGIIRILLWEAMGFTGYGEHYNLVALVVGISLVGVVTFGSLTGSMLPFLLRRLGFDPASASAPFVATLVDVTGIVIYFSVAAVLLRGVLL